MFNVHYKDNECIIYPRVTAGPGVAGISWCEPVNGDDCAETFQEEVETRAILHALKHVNQIRFKLFF